MSNKMEGPIQVLAPRAIALSQRELYSSNKGSNGSTTNHGSASASGGGMPANKTGSGNEMDSPTVGAVEGEELGVPGGLKAPTGLVLPVGSVPAPSRIPSSASASLKLPPRSQRQHNTRRRIFVQTDSGAVVVVEVDCAAGGSAASEKVKRSVQEALNVPTEQADLMFGGHVLEDLNELQNDVPVLLRRGITRSASSPCINRLSSSAPSTHAGALFSSGCMSARGLALGTTNCPGCEGGERDFSSLEASSSGDDSSVGFEVVGGVQPCITLQALIQEAMAGVLDGMEPETATGGTGGAYCFRNTAGEKVVIVKPTDEEPFAPNNPNGYVGRALGQPGLKRAVRVGEAGIREVAAYLLDHDSFAGVPYTALVRAAHPSFNVNASATPVPAVPKSCSAPGCGGRAGAPEATASAAPANAGQGEGPGLASGAFLGSGRSGVAAVPSKLCSLQQYMQHDYDTSECGTSRFPVSAVHRIGILDIRIFNTDRHSGNILVRRLGNERFERRHVNPVFRVDEAVQLIPIDHGFCLPETLDAAYFEWLHWPQASLPFSEEELQYIASLNVDDEVAMLRERLPMLREGCLRVLRLSTTLLQRGAAACLTLADIGAIMSREVRGMEEVASELEALCLQALKLVTTPPDLLLTLDEPSAYSSARVEGHLVGGARRGLLSATFGGAVQSLGKGVTEDARFGCVSPRSVGSSNLSSPRGQMELGAPGLLFDFEEVAEEEDDDSDGESERSLHFSLPRAPVVPEAQPLDLPPLAGSPPAEGSPEDGTADAPSLSSPYWPLLKRGHGGSLTSMGPGGHPLAQLRGGGGHGGGGLLHQALGNGAVRSPRPPRTSGLSRALFKDAVPGKPAASSGLGLALAEGEPAPEPAQPPAPAGGHGLLSSAFMSQPVSGARKVPTRRENPVARRAMPPLITAGKALFHTPPPQHPFRELSPPLPSISGPLGAGAPRGLGPSGLKLGSAGVLGTRLKANVGLTEDEEDLKGLLPGGASLLLADMEQRTWERFYETFVELLDSLLLSKVAERSHSADLFGTSCQF